MNDFGERDSHPVEPEHLSWEYSLMAITELAESRAWLIAVQYPPSPEIRPRVLLQQYENVQIPADTSEEWRQEGPQVIENEETAHIWCYPEDLDAIIERLTRVRDELREAAEEDRRDKTPAYWGAFGNPP